MLVLAWNFQPCYGLYLLRIQCSELVVRTNMMGFLIRQCAFAFKADLIWLSLIPFDSPRLPRVRVIGCFWTLSDTYKGV